MFTFRKNSKTIWFSLLISLFLFGVSVVLAETEGEKTPPAKVNYQNNPVIDSDFDGLTDQGEIQIYHTDPSNPDTDGDGFYDGTEILRRTDPLNMADPIDFRLANEIKKDITSETPWVWYATRSAGLLGFVFLWLTVFLGLSIRNNPLKKIIQPIYSFSFHCFLGASALFWAFIHGGSILFDKFFGMKIKDISIPFHFKYDKFIFGEIDYLALGIIAFYLMIVLIFTSYFKKFISQKTWRMFHFLSPVAFVFVVLHGYFIGTDMRNIWIKNIFLGSSALLVLVYISNLFFALWNNWKKDEIENKN